MTGLLEFKEHIKEFYSKNDVYIIPVVKLLLAFIVLSIINSQMGYMSQIDNILIVLLLALTCSFLPTAAIVIFSAMVSLMHMYALGMEVAVVGVCIYLLIYLLFIKLSGKEAIVIVLTPIFCFLQIPYFIPVAMGLLGTPASAVPVGCGVSVYYLIHAITTNAKTISTMGDDEAIHKIRLIMDGVFGNRAMIVMIVAFTITVIIVYLVRRLSIDYAWTIAIVAGAMSDMVILLLGDLMYDTNLSVIAVVLGIFVAIAVGKAIEFFRNCLDYSRTERVQFEDDEYYYYVKAVPKMIVTTPTKTVKKINSQRVPYDNYEAYESYEDDMEYGQEDLGEDDGVY